MKIIRVVNCFSTSLHTGDPGLGECVSPAPFSTRIPSSRIPHLHRAELVSVDPSLPLPRPSAALTGAVPSSSFVIITIFINPFCFFTSFFFPLALDLPSSGLSARPQLWLQDALRGTGQGSSFSGFIEQRTGQVMQHVKCSRFFFPGVLLLSGSAYLLGA